MLCICTKPVVYDKQCRDCYEDSMRREDRDVRYNSPQTTRDRMLRKERCKSSFYTKYDYNEKRVNKEEPRRRNRRKVKEVV